MSKLYITEFTAPLPTTGGSIPLETGTDQVVSFTTTTQSTALQNNTQLVRLHSDGICSIAVGTNPTATTSTRRLAASVDYWIAVPLNSGWKIAAVTNT